MTFISLKAFRGVCIELNPVSSEGGNGEGISQMLTQVSVNQQHLADRLLSQWGVKPAQTIVLHKSVSVNGD